MSNRTPEDLNRYLQDELAWRRKELHEYHSLVKTAETKRAQLLFVRGAIAILYAHWEGFVKAAGEAYIAGDTASATFPITPGASQTRFGGRVVGDETAFGDAFVAKLDAAGANLLYSTYLGGTSPDIAWGIAVDKNGNAYVAGGTQSADFPVTAGVFQSKYAGGTALSEGAAIASERFF